MIKNLYVIRHGEAEHLLENKFTGGWTNSCLTDKGRFQAKKTGQCLDRFIRNHDYEFYCSDLARAVESANIIGEGIDKIPIPTGKLRELNNGDAANLTPEEAKKIALPETEPFMDWIHYPNAESWGDMNNRVFGFMNMLMHSDKENFLIVTHRGVIVSIIDWWLELNDFYMNKISYDIDPSSITYLRINKWGEKTISKLNDVSHL